ncbi:ABC transporter permease [Streptomyces sp. NPDC047017]|uniref:ABC transporter permease n=1 Tax=Streptomyces sp. NPDC047017 TaxID=3155024 RepID=UPI003404283F
MSGTVQPRTTSEDFSGTPRRGRTGRVRLSGLPWLVWRQHRLTFVLLLAAGAATTAGVLWLAQDATSAVAAVEGPHPSLAKVAALDSVYQRLEPVGLALTCLPFVIGVFVGAPLFAGDLETGTAKFVGVQSRSRWNWVTTKLLMAASFVIVVALSTGLAVKALWSPLARHAAVNADFTTAGGFDTTGPVVVALSLLGLLIGAASGLLLRRTLPAMVTTFIVLLAVKAVWGSVRMMFAPTLTKTTGGGRFGSEDFPQISASALSIDHSYVTGDGSLVGWGSCVNAEDSPACLRDKGVVGWSVEYLPYSHMNAMQWAAAGALAALIAVTVGVVAYAARRTMR